MITVEFLNSVRGDAPMYIEDGNPEQRQRIATKLMELLKEGQAIFLIQGNETRRIQGYDAEANQWLVLADPKPRPDSTQISRRRGRGASVQRFHAGGTRVTAVGQSAGG